MPLINKMCFCFQLQYREETSVESPTHGNRLADILAQFLRLTPRFQSFTDLKVSISFIVLFLKQTCSELKFDSFEKVHKISIYRRFK